MRKYFDLLDNDQLDFIANELEMTRDEILCM